MPINASKDALVIAGSCPLCLQSAALQKSHLLPKALYKTVRGDGPNPHPLHITPGNWRQSSFQDWAHLLCIDCEQRLHRGGEDWTLRHLLRKDGTFKLRDKIVANSQCLTSESFTAFQVDIAAEVDFKQLAYFAVSIIWKAAAYPWRGDGNEISLGSRYFEEFRRYLMNEGNFPRECIFPYRHHAP
jgi:hypothetical protein